MGFDLGLGQFVATLEGSVDQGFNGLHGTGSLIEGRETDAVGLVAKSTRCGMPIPQRRATSAPDSATSRGDFIRL
jgi:hypothetical protein